MLDLFDLVAHVHPPTSARIESLTEHSKGRPIGVLVTLVEAYEQKHYRIDPPDPIEAIKFRVEQLELKPSAWRISSGRSRVSEILNKKRKLTVEIMRSLRKRLAIPAESLLA